MPLDTSLREKILASVERGFDEQIAYTQDLIRLRSVRGDEHVIQDRVFGELRRRGYAMERYEMDQDAIERHPGGSPFSKEHSRAPIVVGIHRPRGGNRTFADPSGPCRCRARGAGFAMDPPSPMIRSSRETGSTAAAAPT